MHTPKKILAPPLAVPIGADARKILICGCLDITFNLQGEKSYISSDERVSKRPLSPPRCANVRKNLIIVYKIDLQLQDERNVYRIISKQAHCPIQYDFTSMKATQQMRHYASNLKKSQKIKLQMKTRKCANFGLRLVQSSARNWSLFPAKIWECPLFIRSFPLFRLQCVVFILFNGS